MLKKTVVIADASVISAFKIICRKTGRVPSKLIEGWMITFVQREQSVTANVRVKSKISKTSGKSVVN